MENKLHTTSHYTSNHVTSSLSRSQHTIMLKSRPHSILYVLFSILLTLFSIPTTAQNYQWDWAINGGSNNNGRDYWRYDTEQVYDIVVGSDDNYYFLANINRSAVGTDSQLAGQPVTVYNSYDPNVLDIFL